MKFERRKDGLLEFNEMKIAWNCARVSHFAL